MKGYVLIEYSRDENYYNVYSTREDAEKVFIKVAKNIGKALNDPGILASDQDDMEELATGGCYSFNGELILEIAACDININFYDHDRQNRIKTAFCNVGEDDWPEDIVEHLDDKNTNDSSVSYCRYNDKTDKNAVVWEPFELHTNQELINYIETGSFDN